MDYLDLEGCFISFASESIETSHMRITSILHDIMSKVFLHLNHRGGNFDPFAYEWIDLNFVLSQSQTG